MPLRDDLLTPIPGANPGGENLRYSTIVDKIKEARREEDDAPQGEWQRERKVADYPTVIKLAGDAIATKSKDLQLAAWLTEALLKREGIGGLRSGLQLIKSLLENFWDHLYPELEDGDPEMRAVPLEWIGTKLDEAVRKAPLTKSGYDWYSYKDSRAVGYEEACEGDSAKLEARALKIADGKLTPEEFDKAFTATPKDFYAKTTEDLEATLVLVEELSALGEEKFGDVAPGYGRLKTAIEEVQNTVRILLQKKREVEPDDEPAVEEQPEEPSYIEETVTAGESSSEAAAAPVRAPVRTAKKVTSIEPVDRGDAVDRVTAAARFLRQQDAYDPVPYLMIRGLRWGELRTSETIDAALLVPPATEMRQRIKQASLEGNWEAVLNAAEEAMAMPCGRGWLDLQRYVVRACQELGSYYDRIAAAVKSSLRELLADYPHLPEMTLMDDTPVANPETQQWLRGEIVPVSPNRFPTAITATPVRSGPEESTEDDGPKPPDAFEIAMQAVHNGRVQEAIEILMREAAQEQSGRGRFQRKVQLAQVCMSTGYEQVALPILEEISAEIDEHRLEEWEAPEVVAHSLALLCRCIDKIAPDSPERRKIYARICRLDPMQALSCTG